MFNSGTNGGAKYRKYAHQSTTGVTHHHFLELELGAANDILVSGELNSGILDDIYHGYVEEYKEQINLRTNPFQRIFRHVKTFIRHKSYEVDPHSMPPVDAIVIRLQNTEGVDNNYVNQVFKRACLDGIRRAETSSERWNTAKEVANIVLPVPLGLATFFTGYALGAEGVAWAALAEFGPYAFLPFAIWAKSKEHKKRMELEEMVNNRKPTNELEDTRDAMERYNTIKDVNSFWVPVTFDSALTGLSYSHTIPTHTGYMTGIVAAPYAAHALGFFSMLKEYGNDERTAILRKMMETKVIFADSRAKPNEIIGRYL